MQDKLTNSIKEVVADQVKQGFKSHAAVIEDSVINAVRSRAVTPSPHIDSHVCYPYLTDQSLWTLINNLAVLSYVWLFGKLRYVLGSNVDTNSAKFIERQF